MLPAGKYLVKMYVDTTGRLAKDWKATLGDDDYAGQWSFGAGRRGTEDDGSRRPAREKVTQRRSH